MASDSKAARARQMGLKQRLDKANAMASARSESCAAIVDRIGSFERALCDISAGVAGRLHRGLQSLQNHGKRLASCERSMRHLISSTQSLVRRKGDAERSLSALRAKAAGDDALLSRTSSRCESLEEALGEATSRCTKLQDALNEARANVVKGNANASLEMKQALREQAALSELRYNELFDDHKALQKEHSRLVLAFRGVQGELDSSKRRSKVRVDATIARLKGSLEQRTQEVRNLRKERNALLRGARA